jgi:hypothetical protein
MKIDLQTYRQDKKTVAEYEVGFNKIVRFVPHVANNDIEKASQFRQGLRPSIRHILGALPLVDFRTTVEQALGVQMQHLYTGEIKSSGGDLVDQRRKEKPSVLTHIATSLVSLVLQQEVVKRIELFLSWEWGWCASVVVMHTTC